MKRLNRPRATPLRGHYACRGRRTDSVIHAALEARFGEPGARNHHPGRDSVFDRVAKGAGTRVVRTAVQAPLMNSVCERFLGSVRRECLDYRVAA
jgi:hypothetical protein